MSGTATDYLRGNVLGHTLGFLAYPMPAQAYVALCLTAPTATTGGTEVAVAGYQRLQGTYGLVAGRTDLASNTATLEWAPASAAWGMIGWFELWDALTAGHRLYQGPLVDPVDGVTPITRAVQAGDIVRLSVGTIQVRAT